MIQFAVSSWSLDGLLTSGLPLLELPSQLKAHNIPHLELCHFHLPETSPEYLQAFRKALKENNVNLYSLLIDIGDIANPDNHKRHEDIREIKNWIDIAQTLGADQVRIVAGNQEATAEVIQRSSQNLQELARYGKEKGLHTSTENWQKTSANADVLLQILELNPDVRLIADIGNAEGNDKYQTLAKLLPRANSIHFKVRYLEDESAEPEDLAKVLELIKQSNFSGVITLIYDKKHDEWKGIEALRDNLQPLLSI
jgi:sugar phosphate isomerase/epimerase